MIRTRVGYAGGTTDAPTYHAMGDHSEAIQIDFDPSVISYEQICEVFWRSHNPCGQSWSKQYASVLFYEDDTQLETASSTGQAVEGKVTTPSVALQAFYRAEDYHQKYQLRNSALMESLRSIFKSDREFVDSTLSMRLNAYLGGNLDRSSLLEELTRLGFEPTSDGPIRAIRALPR